MQAKELREALVFKGAKILNLHLQDNRESMDIDAAALSEWQAHIPSFGEQIKFLETHLTSAVRYFFEKQNPVRYTLRNVKIDRKPSHGHPCG